MAFVAVLFLAGRANARPYMLAHTVLRYVYEQQSKIWLSNRCCSRAWFSIFLRQAVRNVLQGAIYLVNAQQIVDSPGTDTWYIIVVIVADVTYSIQLHATVQVSVSTPAQ